MKILITTPLFHPENHKITSFVSCFHNFIKKEHNVKIVTFGKTNTNNDTNIHIVNKRENLVIRNLKFVFAVLKSRDVDFIFCQNAITAAIPSIIVAKIFKIKLMINFHNDEIYERFLFINKNNISLEDFYKKKAELDMGIYLRFLVYIQKNILKFSDIVVVPNDYFKKVFCENHKLKQGNFVTIYPFMMPENYSPFKTSKDLFSIMTTVALESNAETEVEKLILSVKSLLNFYPNLILNIFGDGKSKERLTNFSIKNGTNSFVIFHGKVSNTELIHYKKMSSIFILLFPSVRNIFNLVENFEYSTISLLRKNEIADEHIKNGETGLTFESDKPNNLEGKILEILSDEKLRAIILKNSTY